MSLDGVCTPRCMIIGEHVSFTIDNSDFSEDTPDGKNTLHGITLTIYQLCKDGQKTEPLYLTGWATEKSPSDIPSIITSLHPCQMPKHPQPPSPAHPSFGLNLQMPLKAERGQAA